jgi:hypothetical protein
VGQRAINLPFEFAKHDGVLPQGLGHGIDAPPGLLDGPLVIFGALVALLANADDKIALAVISLLDMIIGGGQLTAFIWSQRMKDY